MFKYIITVIVLFISATSSSTWELKKDKDGIKIYTRSIEGLSFKEYKGETTIPNVSVTDVLNVIFDVKNYDKLFPDISGQKKLKDLGKYHSIHYVIIHTPWPVSDRDNVAEMNATIAEDGKSAHVSIVSRPDYIPLKKGLVRADGKGFWELKETSGGNVNVTYQYRGNPGGSVPAWLANSFVVSQPFKTLLNLKKRLQ